ncbi:universal stress protein [Microbacterium schleiferi]|uniref:Universal stress protein n=2 Tax=Microbacterium TaxID=33882 RepID=A0ABU7V497_9MICO|nr:universal stress protein [Micrococcales bacterium]
MTDIPASAEPSAPETSTTIVVGATSKPGSRRAIEWAVARAASTGARLELLSVVGGAVGAVGEQEVVQRAVDYEEAFLRNEAAALSSRGIDVTVRVTHGNPTKELVEASADAALLVIGSDHTGGADKHRGPHGTRIVAGAHCPVVVVPDIDTTGRTGVVVGVDGSEVSTAALAFAAAEASRFAEPLTVVSTWMPVVYTGDIAPYPDMYLTDLQGTTEAFAQSMADEVRKDHPHLEIVVHVDEGDPATVIAEVAASARLAVVGTHGRTGFARFLLGSVSTQVLDHLTTVTAAVR